MKALRLLGGPNLLAAVVSALFAISIAAAPQTSHPSPDPAKLFRQGQDALSRNDLAAAESAFRAVLSVDPHSAAAYANLGVVEMRLQLCKF